MALARRGEPLCPQADRGPHGARRRGQAVALPRLGLRATAGRSVAPRALARVDDPLAFARPLPRRHRVSVGALRPRAPPGRVDRVDGAQPPRPRRPAPRPRGARAEGPSGKVFRGVRALRLGGGRRARDGLSRALRGHAARALRPRLSAALRLRRAPHGAPSRVGRRRRRAAACVRGRDRAVQEPPGGGEGVGRSVDVARPLGRRGARGR